MGLEKEDRGKGGEGIKGPVGSHIGDWFDAAKGRLPSLLFRRFDVVIRRVSHVKDLFRVNSQVFDPLRHVIEDGS